MIKKKGQLLIELLLAIGLMAIILPALIVGLASSRDGAAQEDRRAEALTLLQSTNEALRNVREKGWNQFAINGTYHPVIAADFSWSLASGAALVNDFTQQVVLEDVYRDGNGNIASVGGTFDPSTKKAVTTITWNTPLPTTVQSVMFITRHLDNLTWLQTTLEHFNAGIKVQTATTNNNGGEVVIADNTKAKWCAPSFASSTIDLPDGPPVAVSARAHASTSIPNDVFVATSPYATNSVKLAYVNVTANIDPPVTTHKGIFTMDATKYSNPSYIPTGTGLTNSFRTNDIKTYTSASNKTYAILATDMPNKEIIAILIDDNNPANNATTGGEFADPVNKIYKYWTFFNTRQYQGDNRSTPNQDQAPFGYGATSLAIHGSRGYLTSGGYLYVFDLTNIDSKSISSSMDMLGCRIQLDGYDCQPGNGTNRKYNANQTGTSWGDTTPPAHNDCSDGGNIELYADNDLQVVQVGSSIYVYVAVGAATNPELNIVNATNVPTGSSAPTISSTNCGRISNGNASWRRISSLDFNSQTNTEEAANSVYAKSDGTRAYISSNGGIDGDGNGQPDSKQFYVINTSNKNSPQFLSGSSATGATSGFYYGGIITPTPSGSTYHNHEMYPRRSLTVLNGIRAILVGKDGVTNSNETEEYQVLDISSENAPLYCSGINFNQGFNDLTSVTEADFDNFVYMVANTDANELKIIQGGPDGTYLDQGTIESSPLDVGYSTAFNSFVSTNTRPANTDLKFQFAGADAVSGSCALASYSFTGPDGTSGSYYAATGSALFVGTAGSYKNPARCLKYKAFLSTTDFFTTPVLQDVIVNYSP